MGLYQDKYIFFTSINSFRYRWKDTVITAHKNIDDACIFYVYAKKDNWTKKACLCYNMDGYMLK